MTREDVTSLRERLWDAGYRPVAVFGINASVNSPGKQPVGDDWQIRARLNPPEAADRNADPVALNTGVLADGLRAIDIDVDNETIARAIRNQIAATFPETAIRYRSGSPRCLFVFRAANGEPAKRVLSGTFGKVEVLGKGNQFVAYGQHPSGAKLEWFPEDLTQLTVEQLPAITEDQVTEMFRALAPMLGAEIKPERSAGEHKTSEMGLTADSLDVAAALAAIPNDGPADWEKWNRVGMAVWNATKGNQMGHVAFTAWSAKHPSHDPALVDERWNHYPDSPPSTIGAGSIFAMAKEAREGWRKPSSGPNEAERSARSPEQAANDVPEQDLFPLTWFEDIHPVADAKDFVQGVLIEQSAAVVYGESNAGKTFWTTDLALHVAAGKEWCGRRIEGGPVIYCALEGGVGFQNRVSAWRAKHGMEDAVIPFAALQVSLNLLKPEADTPRLIATLRRVAEQRGQPKLIVIDTLSRAMAGGNENAPDDMGALVRNMDAIKQAIGCCVLFIHHSGKDAAKGARGHSLLRAAIDTEIEVKAEEGNNLKTATVVKQRELKKGDVFGFTLDIIQVGQNRHGEDVTTCVIEPTSTDTPDMSGPRNRVRSLSGDTRIAFEVLQSLMAERGASDFRGAPEGVLSVPADWWRERFYDRGKAGASADAKQKAFTRAVTNLTEKHAIGAGNGRVWIAW